MKFKLLLIVALIQFYTYGQGYVCAVGGGSENNNDWSDEPYSWIVQKADSGTIIVLSYSEATNWIPNYFKNLGASESYNKKIDSRLLADQQSTYDEIVTAKGVFIRGGDQWQYINLWKGTKTEDAIRQVFLNGGVVSGTSAGAMILGEAVFTAKFGSVVSRTSLLNPFANAIDIEYNFLNLTPDVLFDTHFIERGRFGRLISMLFKAKTNHQRDILAVGIDDRTAICIDKNGIGTVMGSGAVAIFYTDENSAISGSTTNYVIESLKCDQLTKGWSFDFVNRHISSIPTSAKEVDLTRPWQFPVTSFTSSGTNQLSIQYQPQILEFINSTNNTNIKILSDQAASSDAEAIVNFLTANDFNASSIIISASVMDDPTTASNISDATCFIITVNNLTHLALLSDTTKMAGQSFKEKIESNTIIYFVGNAGKLTGEFFVDNTDNQVYASYRGQMVNRIGLNIFGDLIFQPLIFQDADYFENRSSSVLWGLMRNRKRIGIYLDRNDLINVNALNNTISGKGTLPLMIIDARGTTFVDSSTYRASSTNGPRQTIAMNNLRYSFSRNDSLLYSIEEGKFIDLTSVKDETIIPGSILLHQNYPNPFNPSTIISFELAGRGKVILSIYDILGRKIATLIDNEYKEAGLHSFQYSNLNNDLSSGIYFYTLKVFYAEERSGEFMQTRKMILLR